jgi:hypothetical protein
MQLFTREFIERKKEYSPFVVLKLIRPRYKILYKFVSFHDCPFFLVIGEFYEKCQYKAMNLKSKLMVRKRCVFYKSVSNSVNLASKGIFTVV